MTKTLAALALTLALVLGGCAVGPTYADAPDEKFEGLIAVTGDALDGYRSADSSKVRPFDYNDGQVRSHVYVRAIAYDTGRRLVRIVFKTTAKAWLHPSALNFGDPLRSLQPIRMTSDVYCYSDPCTHYETTAFDLSADDVRWILSDTAPENIELRLKSRADTDRTIRKAEFRATLAAVGLLDDFEGAG